MVYTCLLLMYHIHNTVSKQKREVEERWHSRTLTHPWRVSTTNTELPVTHPPHPQEARRHWAGGEKQTSRTAKGPQAEGPRGHRQNGQGATSRRAKSQRPRGRRRERGTQHAWGASANPRKAGGTAALPVRAHPAQRRGSKCNKRQTLFDDLIWTQVETRVPGKYKNVLA